MNLSLTNSNRLTAALTGRRSLQIAGLVRYLSVGAVTTALDFAIFSLLYSFLGVEAVAANVVSYTLSAASNFWLHRQVTFGTRAQAGARVAAARYTTVALTALLVNTLFVQSLLPWLQSLTAAGPAAGLAAKTVAAALCGVWIFLANNTWTFRARPAQSLR